ncbi:F-box domain-containing protein [Artemisia annua]|uniref:F-box domain-containing protein n=1 Tax=Artemisia annua TaxID=35608 RepID=A0A2U1KM30_ARTAN|nr:F-box domain-containing protein [Artemisia annua]
MTPVGSCSGITSFLYGGNMMAVLWNPSLRKSVCAFIPYYTNQIEYSRICFGFGVRPDTLDPTIVKVSYPVFHSGFWYVSVFSLNALSWKRLDNFQLPRESIRLKRKSQEVVGRFIYWAGTEKLVSEKGVPYKDYTLISFDMITSQFHVIEIPSLLKVVMPMPFSVSGLGNSVIISGMIMTYVIPLFCAWRLEVDGASITRFSNLFGIPTPMVNKLIGFTSNESPIVEANVGHILGH